MVLWGVALGASLTGLASVALRGKPDDAGIWVAMASGMLGLVSILGILATVMN